MHRFMKKNHLMWLFLLPSLLGLMIFYLIPFVMSLYYAMIENMSTKKFVGFKNFADTLKSDAFLTGLSNTGIFIGLTITIGMFLALLIALMIRKMEKCRGVMALIFLLPLVIPTGTMVFIWKSIFEKHGLLNRLLYTLDMKQVLWLDSRFAMVILLIMFLWKNIGYNMVFFWTGLNLIPKEYYEIAMMEGTGRFYRFTHITAIYLAPTSFMVILMSFVNSFKVFREVYLLLGNYPGKNIYMLQHYMNNQFFSMNMQKLTSAAYIIAGMVLIVVLVLFRIQKKLTDSYQ
jgi:multiple sugar transport system permease protein